MKIKPKGWNPNQTSTRFAETAPSTYDPKARTVEAILSRGSPVQRFFGVEKLRIAADAVMLDRMQSAGVPLLDSHNQYGIGSALGRIEKVWFVNGALMGLLSFNDTEEGRKAEGMVARGEIAGISVGYIVHEWTISDGDGRIIDPEVMVIDYDDELTFEATRWELLEASLVTVPADSEAFVRSMDGRKGSENPLGDDRLARGAVKITKRIGNREITYEYPQAKTEEPAITVVVPPAAMLKGNEDVRARMQARQAMSDRMRP